MKTIKNQPEASAKKASAPISLPADQARVKDFLSDPARKQMISINGIERAAGLSQGIVSKFIHGKKALHPKQVDKLLPVLKVIGYEL